MKFDSNLDPCRSTWVTLVTLLASNERERDCQNRAGIFYLMCSVGLCDFGQPVPTTEGTSLVNLGYFSALFEGGELGVWRWHEASPAHGCE